MVNKRTLLITTVLFTSIFLGSTINEIVVATENDLSSLDEVRANSVDMGDLAPDFNITDVDSDITYSLSQFQGKFVLIDFWATWCTWCEVSLPMIRQLYGKFANNFIVISVDIDESETNIGVSNYRKEWKMDWIVGIDYDNSIDLTYNITGVPTFYLLNTTGHVVYYSPGIDVDNFYNDIYALISVGIPEDVTAPSFNEFTVTNSSELSIFHPVVTVTANISEENHLETLSLSMTSPHGSKVTPLKYQKIDGFCIVNQQIIYTMEFLYPIESMNYEIYAADFWSHTNTSETVAVDVTHYEDLGPPTLGEVFITYEHVSDILYNVTVFADIEDDLYLETANLQLKKGTSLVSVVTFTEYNSSFMIASTNVLYSRGEPYEMTAYIIIGDLVGNEVIANYTVADAPETTKTNFEYSLALVGLITSIVVLREFRKRK